MCVELQRCATAIFTAVRLPPLGCEIVTRYQTKISAVVGQFVYLAFWNLLVYMGH